MTEINLDEYYDAVVFDVHGEKVGGVGQVFLDEESGQPSWVTVRTGLFGLKESFVPLVNHRLEEGVLHVDFTKEFIKEAPRQDPEAPMTVAEEDALQAYYGTEDEPEKIEAAYRKRMDEAGHGAAAADKAEYRHEHQGEPPHHAAPAEQDLGEAVHHHEPETEVYGHQTDFAEKAEADLLEDAEEQAAELEADQPPADDDRPVEVDDDR